MIPVIDLFAGPGGLGEGFATFTDAHGRSPFELRSPSRRTYPLTRPCAFVRSGRLIRDSFGAEYGQFLRGVLTADELLSCLERPARAADQEAVRIELPEENTATGRRVITEALKRAQPHGADCPRVLIGGPPCQAYSLVGRSRNKGVKAYRPEADKRQTLYVESEARRG